MLNLFLQLTNNWFKTIQEIMAPVPVPQQNTKNEVVKETNAYKLRKFGSDGWKKYPILISPPQAGHHSLVCDFKPPEQSLVHRCLELGFTTYAIEYKSAGFDRRNESLDDLVTQISECVDTIAAPLHLIGLCQGGYPSAIYTAKRQEKIKSLVVAGSPFDTKAGGGKLQMWLQLLPHAWSQYMVWLNGGTHSGKAQLLGFKCLNPVERFFSDYVSLYWNINDEKYMERHRYFRNWYEYTQDIGGKWCLQVEKDLFRDNALIKGDMVVWGEPVNLRNITCPTVMLGGENDDITLPDQCLNLSEYIGSRFIMKRLIKEVGHIGIFIGKGSLKNEWVDALHYIDNCA